MGVKYTIGVKGLVTPLGALVMDETATALRVMQVTSAGTTVEQTAYQGGEAMSATTWGVSTVGRASSTTPSSVTTGDAVKPWHTLAGAYVVSSSGAAIAVDANGGPTTLADPGGVDRALLVDPQLFNGATWDRNRNNIAGTLLASAARTATTSSADQTNYNGQAVAVTVNVTVVPGVETLTVTIEAKDPVSGAYTTILSSDALVATGTVRMRVGTNITAVSNLAAADVLGRTWRVTVTPSASGSFTYSVGYDVMTA